MDRCPVVVLGGSGYAAYQYFSAPKGPRWITQKSPAATWCKSSVLPARCSRWCSRRSARRCRASSGKSTPTTNDAVKKARVLVELDPALFQAAVRREEANVAAAQAAPLQTKVDARNAGLAAEWARAHSGQELHLARRARLGGAQGEKYARCRLANARRGSSWRRPLSIACAARPKKLGHPSRRSMAW